MSVYSPQQQRNIIFFILIAMGFFIAYSLRNIVAAGLGAIILYTLFRNTYLSFINKRKWKPSISSLSIILFSFILIIIPFFTLGWLVISKISYYNQYPEQIKMLITHLSSTSGLDLEKSGMVINILKNLESWALASFPNVLNAFLNILLMISIMYLLLYFMFVEHVKFEENLENYSPFGHENYLLLANELRNTTYSNVIGQGIIAIVQGGFICIGFLLFGISDPVFWGVVAIMLSFVPIVGSAIVFIPAGLIELSYSDYFAGFGILIWGVLVVANIDNVIRLIINKKIANTHPIITIVGVIIGLPTFGILGLVFGPLLLSYFILLFNIYENKIKLKNSSTNINDESRQ